MAKVNANMGFYAGIPSIRAPEAAPQVISGHRHASSFGMVWTMNRAETRGDYWVTTTEIGRLRRIEWGFPGETIAIRLHERAVRRCGGIVNGYGIARIC
ncbi:MAG: hypothetical protein J0H71_00395 [Rhizobiales bacterium]|nr:hypothetical protein [Hyphomicrobiales bacterium]